MMNETPGTLKMKPRSKTGWLLALVFLIGLLAGWLGIGWMLWPVQWIDARPANLRLADQRQFVALVAGEYAQTGDAALAQERLASWDEESLATLLALMEHQAVDGASRLLLMDLQEALSTPQTDFSLWDTILSQKWVMVSAVLGGLLLLTAVALAIYPSIHKTQTRRKQLAAEEEALLMAAAAPGETVETAVPVPTQPPQPQTAAAETAVSSSPEPPAPNNQPSQPEPTPANPPQPDAPANATPNAPSPPQPRPPGPAAQPDETPAAEKPAAQPPAPSPASPPSPPSQPLLVEEDEEEGTTESIQNILTSVFEEDEDWAHFESLLKGLDDIEIMKLVKQVEETAKQLRARRPRGETAVLPQRNRAGSRT